MVAIAVIVLLIVNATQRKRQRGELRVTNLSEQYQEMKDDLAAALMDGHQQKLWHKAQKKKHKQEAKPPSESEAGGHCDIGQTRVWVIDFKGSMDAHEVNALREEVTAVLAAAKPGDRRLCVWKAPVALCTAMAWRHRNCSACAIKIFR
ncbi:putative protease sohB [Salmonella enterica subsp. enterica]|uniref:Putative protease sohB n=1 Tax=Salmonella enterica I TaxID=59201 RepID=A0A379W849_SALET|nr:putative protease sohB [Salmonella enterica subsp. enterica]